jgi:hypothetical protein
MHLRDVKEHVISIGEELALADVAASRSAVGRQSFNIAGLGP